jgi:hypothetical protein
VPRLLFVCSLERYDDRGQRSNGRAVEMMSAAPGQPFASKWSQRGGAAGAGAGAAAGLANGSDRGPNRDQAVNGSRPGTAGGSSALNPPVSLPAIKTSAGGGSSAATAGAAANGSSSQQQNGGGAAAAKFSLGEDDDELHEIVLDSAKALDKKD